MNNLIYRSIIFSIFCLIGVANATTYTIRQGIARMDMMQPINELFGTTIYHSYLSFHSDDNEFNEFFHASIDPSTFSSSKIILQQKGVKINIHHKPETKMIESKQIYSTSNKQEFLNKLQIADEIYNKYDKQDYILLAGPRCDTITAEAINALGLENKYPNINYVNQSLKTDKQIKKVGKESKKLIKEVVDDYKEAEKLVVTSVKPIIQETKPVVNSAINSSNKHIKRGLRSLKKRKSKWGF